MTAAVADAGRPSAALRVTALALAALILHLALIQPNHPAALTWRALWLFPLELPAVLLGLAALPPGRAATTAVRLVLAALLVAVVVLKIADFATFTALRRAFHPMLDLHLLVSAWHLGSGAIGPTLMGLVILAAVLAVVIAAALLWWATGRWARVELSSPARVGTAALAGLSALIAVADVGDGLGRWHLPVDPPGTAFTARLGAERVRQYSEAARDLRAFRIEAQNDQWAEVSPLMDRIDRDVLLVFVESYGAASLTNPLYSETHRETLASIERDLGEEGLAMRSAWLDAPTFGGQSWLSHATFASGLWVDNQRSYGAYLASPRQSLFQLAQRAGFRTAAVMPAITMNWPEAELMGFDTVLPAAGLGYRGQPFNWVTMPDQFTLAALDRLVRADSAPPLFAQVALVSSHAPWVPVPEVIPWDAVGDGTIFDVWATSGDPPEVVWRDRDRIRAQYRKAIDYSLGVVGAYAALHADDLPLMIVLGDHPPARTVAQDESDAVPIHLIGPPALIELIDEWSWTSGLVPDDQAPLWRMSAFRDRFLAAFSTGRP